MARLLTLRDIAEYAGVSYKTVARWSSTGQIATVRAGGVIRVTESALADFVAAHTVPGRPRRRPLHQPLPERR
jgi:excisionase family DNA binding protein